MVSQEELIFKGYLSLVPGLILIIHRDGMVPIIKLEKVFLGEHIVAVSFFKTVLYTHIHNTHPIFEIIYACPVIHCMIYTAQNDISKTCRTFSLKINKLYTFCETTHVWQCLMTVFIWSVEFTY